MTSCTHQAADKVPLRDIDERFGEAAIEMASQALVWAFVLDEIPRQIIVHERVVLRALKTRHHNEQAYWPGSPECHAIERAIHARQSWPFAAEIEPTRAAIFFYGHGDKGPRVEFTTAHGAVHIHCKGVPEESKRLPSFVRRTKSFDDARGAARSLVIGAIHLLDEDAMRVAFPNGTAT